MKKFFLIFAVIFSIFYESSSGLIINEVLVNEPGNNTTLEWIELYNEQIATISLAGYSIPFSGDTILLPDSVTLLPGEYYIICRRLFAIGDSPGFETVWGDSSGVWGNTPFESALQQPFVSSFSLVNGSGVIVLEENNNVVSGLVWSIPGIDGYSWERVTPAAGNVLQSLTEGGTPGMINSVTPVPFDLSMDSVTVSFDNGFTQLSFHISNRGENNVSGAIFDLLENDISIDLIDVGTITVGESVSISKEYTFNGLYLTLAAVLSQDDRNSNNRLDFMAVGADYPPLMLTELMANPFYELNTEWLEFKNISDLTLDLSLWQFGDALNLYQISDTTLTINPGEYFVLADSENDFLNFFLDFDGTVIEPSQWSTFNNTGDIVRLVDQYSIEADRFTYDSTLSNNYTWSRSEEIGFENRWGRSDAEHGTPGEINKVFFGPEGSELTVNINPTHFSPDGDGFEDETYITINIPEADNYTVKIYDRYGRVVRIFHDQSFNLEDEFTIIWDGKTDQGIRLPIGIYILFVEADGVVSQKHTMVIAR